jgi:hypothetical protein
MRPSAALMIARFKPSLSASCGLVLGTMLLSCACTHTRGPRGLTDSTYAAARKAVDALERASENRNSSASIFDPKLQAASKAADEVYHDMGNQSSDGYAANQIRSCIDQLKAYRSNFDSRESVSRPIEDQLKELKATQMKDANDVVARGGKDLDDCIQAAKSYL